MTELLVAWATAATAIAALLAWRLRTVNCRIKALSARVKLRAETLQNQPTNGARHGRRSN